MVGFMMKITNGLISLVLSLVLLTAGAYAAYCLWDNNQIYSAAENVQAEMLAFKPAVGDEADANAGPTFADLLALNPDVCGWVTVDNTQIDYPVLQGEDNLTYINTDVYGNFALAGSIFLDSRNDRTFADPYSVLYGHHMENSSMFGDLDLYKHDEFFRKNQTGMLILPDRTCSLRIFACMQVAASEERIFNPNRWDAGVKGLLDYAEADALHIDPDAIAQLHDRIDAGEKTQVLALTTCAYEFTDARTVVLAVMNDHGREDKEDGYQ